MYMCGPSMSVLIFCIQNSVLSYFQCWLILRNWGENWPGFQTGSHHEKPKGISIGDTWIEQHTFGFGSRLNENQPFENRPKGNERYQW
jgi:hypothetical protein